MQLRFATDLSAEEYVRRKAWKETKLDNCPIHPEGGCGFRKNGTYSRKYPEGTKIARWYCPMGHQTFSFLPDCLSARLPGELKEVENVIEEVEKSPSQEKAAKNIRLDIFLPGALRWVRRRILPIRSALTMLIELISSMFLACDPDIIEEKLAAKRYLKELETNLRRDMKEMELRLKHDLTLRLGAMLAASIAIVCCNSNKATLINS